MNPATSGSLSKGFTKPGVDSSARFLSLDVYRGITIAFMIIVNTPGTWEHVYAPLCHAQWLGCTPADVVFPTFMFIVGVSMWFSFQKFDHRLSAEAAKKILRRTLLIFIIGLLLNKFPIYWKSLDHWRIMGILQRLALGYCFASFLVLTLGRRALIAAAAGMLLLYWGLLNWFAVPGGNPYALETNAVLRVDRWIYGAEINAIVHLEHWLYGNNYTWHGHGAHFDAEGWLSTLPAIVTVILGWWAGQLMSYRSSQKMLLVRDLLALGVVLGFAGLAWDLVFPISKKLWTSSYVLYTGGISMILLAAGIWLMDIRGWRSGTGFFRVFGANPLFAFVFAEALTQFFFEIEWMENGINYDVYSWLYTHLFRPINETEPGSLLFALAYMMLCWFVCRWLYVRNIFIKI